MTQINNISESRKAVATKVAENYFGVSTETINNIVNKFVRKAVKEQDMPYCSTIVETYIAGAERYRITIEGAYNDLQDGGTKKTDFCFANIRFEIKGINGLYAPYGDEQVRVNGVSAGEFAKMIFNTIMVYYLEMAENWRHRIVDANRAIEDAYDFVMSDIVDDAQTDVENYMEDLTMWAEKYSDIDDKFYAVVAADVLKKIKQVSDDCLERVGDACGCSMVWDDGYHVDLSEIGKWYGGVSYSDMDDRDLENLIDTLDFMSSSESDLPLGLEQEDIDWIKMGEGASYCGLQPLYTGETAYDFVMANV